MKNGMIPMVNTNPYFLAIRFDATQISYKFAVIILAIVRTFFNGINIQEIYPSAKVFSDCQARNEKAIDFHLNASLMALNVAKAEQRSRVAQEELSTLSMASVKHRALNDYLLHLFIDKLGLCRTLI